jgi:pimeloyl-ACP methyl ester carboxylesterase
MRRRAAAVLATAITLLPLGWVGSASGSDTVRVGSLELRPCHVVADALCGSIARPWEPGHPGAGKVEVGFAFRPATDTSRPALGTLVPHEGGPGYSTTGTGSSYAAMYGSLLERRNLLLVDQRGTGRSEPIDCPQLQDLKIAYAEAAAGCGAQLGERADDYTTALSADDLAAVIEALELKRVDVYGDSYGTFFAQVFVGRHPELIRTVVLDASYPTYGESGWYPTQGPAVRRAFDVVCARSEPCRSSGPGFLPTLRRVLAKVRERPWRGQAYDADGRRMAVTVDGPGLVAVAYGATYTPAFYRELTAALRSGLAGDRAPLRRLVAEATGGDTDAGPVSAYSEGLDAAVACHDYPQLYDMSAPPAVRREQYAAALAARQASHPHTYGPFTVAEYAGSDWQYLDWCTDWPTAPPDNPAGPPVPPSSYPDVPVLVLTGELDTITTPAEATLVTRQFPYARRVVLRNSFHVTAIGDTDDCAQRIVRYWIATQGVVIPNSLRACTREVPPVRALGVFPAALPADASPRRVAQAAALTVADLPDRWWNNYSGRGVGLRGGNWRYAGYDRVRFTLDRVRLVRGLSVSGSAVWDRYAGTMVVDLTVDGVAAGRLHGDWGTGAPGAVATLTGVLDGQSVRVSMPAP